MDFRCDKTHKTATKTEFRMRARNAKQNSECAPETQATPEVLEGSLDENSGFQECVKPCSQEAEEWNERLNELILQKKNLGA